MVFDFQLFPVKGHKAAGTLPLISPILCVANTKETHAKDYTDILYTGALASFEIFLITSICAQKTESGLFLLECSMGKSKNMSKSVSSNLFSLFFLSSTSHTPGNEYGDKSEA